MNYYNEFDEFAAQWLRNLISKGLIPDGHVDTRSICDVQATDLVGYRQCHFFAGIGGWPLALRLAGIADDENIWTGSCPCQPFSVAGRQKGQADERHLWPVFSNLIRQCNPEWTFGEQVSAAIRLGWVDGVQTDMENAGNSFGYLVCGAHSVGAPHIRQRLFWGAKRISSGCKGLQHSESDGWNARGTESIGGGVASGCSESGGIPDSRRIGRWTQGYKKQQAARNDWSGPWSDYTIGHYRDGKARRIGRCVFPLAPGIPSSLGRGKPELRQLAKRARCNRTGRLKGYGNAIVPQVAAVFVQAFMDQFN